MSCIIVYIIGMIVGIWIAWMIRKKSRIGTLMIVDQENSKPAMVLEISSEIGNKPDWIATVREMDYVVLDVRSISRK